MRVYNRAMGNSSWSYYDEILDLISAIRYEYLFKRTWLAGEEIFDTVSTSITFYYQDHFRYDVYEPITTQQRAYWRERDTWFGPAYDHAWIEFESECDGQKGWGFYPGPGNLGGLRGPGEIRDDTGRGGDGRVVDVLEGAACVAALCDCIRQSARRPPNYSVCIYNCGSWVSDMFECARARCLPKPEPPFSPYPPIPPDGGVPGRCYGYNGRVICP